MCMCDFIHQFGVSVLLVEVRLVDIGFSLHAWPWRGQDVDWKRRLLLFKNILSDCSYSRRTRGKQMQCESHLCIVAVMTSLTEDILIYYLHICSHLPSIPQRRADGAARCTVDYPASSAAAESSHLSVTSHEFVRWPVWSVFVHMCSWNIVYSEYIARCVRIIGYGLTPVLFCCSFTIN